MIGDSQQRKCLATGDWYGLQYYNIQFNHFIKFCAEFERSGTIPRCLELAIANEIENSIEGQSDEHTFDANFESSKAIGIGIAVGAGALLILIIIVAVICLKA